MFLGELEMIRWTSEILFHSTHLFDLKEMQTHNRNI